MAEKEITKAEEKKEKQAAAANARKARDARLAKDRFFYVEEPEKAPAPQAQGIINILKEAKKKGLSRPELVANMEGKIETRQPLGRILSYYSKALIASGAIRVETSE